MLAAKQLRSGAWRNAVPLSNLGLHLDDETLRISVALRIGAAVGEPHVCRCNRVVDRFGHHGLSCRYSAGRFPRHVNLNDVVKHGLAAAGVPSWLGPVGLDRGDGRRPDGITVFSCCIGKSLCCDATCVDTFSDTSVIGAVIESGSLAVRAPCGPIHL